MADRFSDRHGCRETGAEITVQEDAPENLRYAIPLIGRDIGMSPSAMRRIICQVLLVPPDPNNWSDDPNIWDEVVGLVVDCPWYKVYDLAEAFHGALAQRFNDNAADRFDDRLNQFFVENGIGWQVDGGQIVYRGSEAFSGATQEAVEILERTVWSRIPAKAEKLHSGREFHVKKGCVPARPTNEGTCIVDEEFRQRESRMEFARKAILASGSLTLQLQRSRLLSNTRQSRDEKEREHVTGNFVNVKVDRHPFGQVNTVVPLSETDDW